MEDNKHILLVANSLSQAELANIQNTLEDMHKEGLNNKVSILYVKPYFPTCYMHVSSMTSVAEDFESEAKESLQEIGNQLSVRAEHQWIATGRLKQETLKIAATLDVDYILSSRKISKHFSGNAISKRKRAIMPIKSIDNLAA